MPDIENKEIEKEEGVEKFSHGLHVTFISELKNILSKRLPNSNIQIQKKEKEDDPFLNSLIDGKNTLRNITPPPPRKIMLNDVNDVNDVKVFSSSV